MSRHPGESAEQWCDRANAHYLRAWEDFGVQWRRVARTELFGPEDYSLFDEAYDGAMDALADADHERGQAAITLDRELHPVVRGWQADFGSRRWRL